MKTFSTRLSAIWQGLLRSFRDFPVEALISVAVFLLTLLSNEEVIRSAFPLAYFFPLVVLSFCLHRQALRKEGLAWKVCYYVSAFFWIPLYIWKAEPGEADIVVLYLLSFILLFASAGRQADERYAATLLHTLVKGASAVLVSAVLSLVLLAIIASVDALFLQNDLGEKWYVYPQIFVWIIVAPMLCCIFVSEMPGECKDRRFLTIIVEYVLTPALLIYTVILYAYLLRILILWKLPDGGVAYLVGGFVGVALLCRLLQELLSTRHFDWFYRHFPYVAFGPTVLLWVGIVRRVSEYGLTEMRVYLIAVALLLTLFTLMLLWPRTRSFYRMSIITAVVAVLLTYVPGIRARDLGEWSQRLRQEKADGVVADAPESADVPAAPAFYKLEDAVSLDGYTILLPEDSYHYYEDSTVAVFYEDDSREKELLRCEIAARLDSSHPEKLVYRNENYLAVFDSVTDYRSTDEGPAFITGRHTLYARP